MTIYIINWFHKIMLTHHVWFIDTEDCYFKTEEEARQHAEKYISSSLSGQEYTYRIIKIQPHSRWKNKEKETRGEFVPIDTGGKPIQDIPPSDIQRQIEIFEKKREKKE